MLKALFELAAALAQLVFAAAGVGLALVSVVIAAAGLGVLVAAGGGFILACIFVIAVVTALL